MRAAILTILAILLITIVPVQAANLSGAIVISKTIQDLKTAIEVWENDESVSKEKRDEIVKLLKEMRERAVDNFLLLLKEDSYGN